MKLTSKLANIESMLVTGDARQALHEWLSTITEMRIFFLKKISPYTAMESIFQSEANRQIIMLERIIVAGINQITLADVCKILAEKPHISTLYKISTYGSSTKARDLLWPNLSHEINALSPAQITSILLLCSYNDFGDFEAKAIETKSIDLQLGFVLAFSSNPFTYTQSQEKWRLWLFDKLESLPDTIDIKPWAPLIAPAAMSCSYASSFDKHGVRAKINKWLSHQLRNTQLPISRASTLAKPRLLIVAEQMQPDHAMYRCYAPSIRSLKDKFNVTMMVSNGDDDGRLSSMAHAFKKVPADLKIDKYLEQIKNHKADVIYYPSIGMSLNSLAAASIRLAPIQIMTNGHPATSMSPNIDYMILVDDVFGGTDLFSEKIILRAKGPHYVRHQMLSPPVTEVRKQPETILVAVPAYLRKVNAHFIEACRQIASQAKKSVQFVFFPNRLGAEHWAVKRTLEAILPARVLPRTNYETYLQNLGKCDIHLSTFPFGSANGVVDSALLGLPIVNLLGREPHARIDANLVGRYNQPSWLTANTIDEYISASVRLINDDALRVKISQQILAFNPASTLLVDEGVACHDFSELFLLLYRKHEEIKTSGKKVWDRHALKAL